MTLTPLMTAVTHILGWNLLNNDRIHFARVSQVSAVVVIYHHFSKVCRIQDERKDSLQKSMKFLSGSNLHSQQFSNLFYGNLFNLIYNIFFCDIEIL